MPLPPAAHWPLPCTHLLQAHTKVVISAHHHLTTLRSGQSAAHCQSKQIGKCDFNKKMNIKTRKNMVLFCGNVFIVVGGDNWGRCWVRGGEKGGGGGPGNVGGIVA